MRILLIAPEPFYTERGTPIAVDQLAQALGERGDVVHVLTTHLGEDRQHPGMKIIRIRPWRAPKRIGPGLSWAKIYCDVFILFSVLKLARRHRYDLVHAVEEGSFMAWIANLFGGPPYIVDIDSSMSAQITARYGWLRWSEPVLEWLESLPLRRAIAAVPVCEALAVNARRLCPGDTILLPDISLRSAGGEPAEDIRSTETIDGPVVMYVGNMEPYQGIDLLLEAFAILDKRGTAAELVLIGGSDAHVRQYADKWRILSGNRRVHFLGPRPVSSLGGYLSQADVLVSPRIEGDNTPMKVYSFLDSGRPVVATALPTHTQVMTDNLAVLVEPDPEAFADGISYALEHPQQSEKMAAAAREFIASHHSPEAFRSRVFDIYARATARLKQA